MIVVRDADRLIAVDPSGAERVVLVDDPSVAEGCDPSVACRVGDAYAWSPDGTQLAFEAGSAGSWAVYVGHAEQGTIQRVAACQGGSRVDPGQCTDLAWSPDGTRLAYASHGILKVLDIGGGTTVIAGCETCPDHRWTGQPDRSPDGTRLAYARDTGGYRVASFDGSPPLTWQLPADQWSGSAPPTADPSWSPDGSISLGSGGDGDGVVLIDPFTLETTAIANPGRKVGSRLPSWAPDGASILYTSEDERRQGDRPCEDIACWAESSLWIAGAPTAPTHGRSSRAAAARSSTTTPSRQMADRWPSASSTIRNVRTRVGST